MKVRELIELLEQEHPDTLVLIPIRGDYLGRLRSPSWSPDNTVVLPTDDLHTWKDAAYEERDQDIPAIII